MARPHINLAGQLELARLSAAARPESHADWGSERQIEAETDFVNQVEARLRDVVDDFESIDDDESLMDAMYKATTDQCIDALLMHCGFGFLNQVVAPSGFKRAHDIVADGFEAVLQDVHPCHWQFDDGPIYEGFTDGTKWNGFDNVLVSLPLFVAILEEMKRDASSDLEREEIAESFSNARVYMTANRREFLVRLGDGFATHIVDAEAEAIAYANRAEQGERLLRDVDQRASDPKADVKASDVIAAIARALDVPRNRFGKLDHVAKADGYAHAEPLRQLAIKLQIPHGGVDTVDQAVMVCRAFLAIDQGRA